jgi:hypothetical protein
VSLSESVSSKKLEFVLARVKSIFEPQNRDELALARHDIDHLLFASRAQKAKVLHMLTTISTQQTHSMISYIKEMTLQ